MFTPGEIYLAHDILQECDVAVKFEPTTSEHQMLEHKYNVMRTLGEGVSIPRLYLFGQEGHFNVIIFDCLGPSIQDLYMHLKSITTVSALTLQMVFTILVFLIAHAHLNFVDLLPPIHSHNFVHQDLKPSNILMGVRNCVSILHVINFGLEKQFRSHDTHLHIPFCGRLGLTGTPLFALNNSHTSFELGRQDDFESLAYVLIYLLHGGLPWEGLADSALVTQQKLDCSVKEVCSGLPNEFATFLSYLHSLPFKDKPDYEFLSGLFDHLQQCEGFHDDALSDWDVMRHVVSIMPSPTVNISHKWKPPITYTHRTG